MKTITLKPNADGQFHGLVRMSVSGEMEIIKPFPKESLDKTVDELIENGFEVLVSSDRFAEVI